MWSVFFVFLSYLDRNFVKGDFLSRALDAERESKEMFSMLNGTFCAKMSTVRESFLYQVSDGAEVVRSFVSPAGKLVNCSVTVNQMQVKSFMHECRLGRKEQRAGQQLETRFARMNEAKLMCREFKERSERSGRERGDDSALQDQVLKRSKRGFTYPGTLWCGAGNMADNYDQLGDFAETDSCCRIHDHCPHVIHSFSTNYGHTNFKWHSICHCDCDNALKACLRNVNDTSSRVVGQAFFNVIGVPCFELAYEEQCAERHWYGMCKLYKKLPIAVLQEAVPYDFGGIDVIDKLTVAPSKKKESKESEEEEKPETNTADNLSVTISIPTIITITPTEQPKQQSFVVSTASAPIEIPKVKRNRSKERRDREGRKKRRKVSLASPFVDAGYENSSTDNLKVIPFTGAPTVPSLPTTERQVSQTIDVYGGKTIVQVTALKSSFTVLKRQKSKGLRSRRRKTVSPFFSSESPPAPAIPLTTAAINRPAEHTETQSEWRLFTTITAAPSIITNRHRQRIRQQRKPRKKVVAAAFDDGVSIPNQTKQTPLTFTTTQSKVATTEELNLLRSEKRHETTSGTPVMSPIQLSIERAKAQFTLKKRRKAAISLRQQ
ncbi:Group 3 secretory phospholipase A2 [Dissostichus eleginoides]|uniref:phospholipase A2 n=1 Tax=Dissostichus eleginoides TaxID=100907 RepID=A0AAD9FIB4_DISEL|nr:Group 3 secretory phospholipase A2 [Dissostichus eleginoides]